MARRGNPLWNKNSMHIGLWFKMQSLPRFHEGGKKRCRKRENSARIVELWLAGKLWDMKGDAANYKIKANSCLAETQAVFLPWHSDTEVCMQRKAARHPHTVWVQVFDSCDPCRASLYTLIWRRKLSEWLRTGRKGVNEGVHGMLGRAVPRAECLKSFSRRRWGRGVILFICSLSSESQENNVKRGSCLTKSWEKDPQDRMQIKWEKCQGLRRGPGGERKDDHVGPLKLNTHSVSGKKQTWSCRKPSPWSAGKDGCSG